MPKIYFTKMQGLSNDFVVINAVNQEIHLIPTQIHQLADRHTGIGFDQLLLVEKSNTVQADFLYRIFNADGSEVGQCGNGARCIAKFIQDEKLSSKKNIRVNTLNGLLELNLNENNSVTVNMGQPIFEPAKIPFIAGKPALTYQVQAAQYVLKLFVLSMGNPHCLLIVPNIRQAQIAEIGSLLTKHPRFPAEVNVGFMQVLDRNTIRLRVYERGVGETKACGSGASAAVVAGRMLGLLNDTVTVEQIGGSAQVRWEGVNNPVLLTGPAVIVFKGIVEI